MLATFERPVNGYSAQSALLAGTFFGRLVGRNPVIAFEPAAKIDLRAASRAERPILRCRWLAANRAATREIRRGELHCDRYNQTGTIWNRSRLRLESASIAIFRPNRFS